MIELLKKIEYALRKDSLTDSERIASARTLVCEAISKAEAIPALAQTPTAPEPGWLAPALDKAAVRAAEMPDWMTRATPSSTEPAQAVPSPLSFVEAMSLAEHGLETWKSKEHNAKWWRRIDGTPIPNDLLVSIAEEFAKCGLVYASDLKREN